MMNLHCDTFIRFLTTVLVLALWASGGKVYELFPRPKWSQYHLPWACSVVHVDDELVSACAIFDANKVLVNVDNFIKEVNVSGKMKKFYEVIGNLYVHVETNLMNPQRYRSWQVPYTQVNRGKSLHIAAVRNDIENIWTPVSSPIGDISKGNSYVQYDHYGIEYSIGILELVRSFYWTDYLQPILIPKNLNEETQSYIENHESLLHRPHDTCITYSWNENTNLIRYHEVMYLPMKNCIELFCTWNLSTCDLFPKRPYYACFKSVTYADVCPKARGAALYCPSFNQSIFGILTTAPSCGRRQMPGVYTTLPYLIEFYESVYKVKFDQEKRPKYDPMGFDQGYSRFG